MQILEEYISYGVVKIAIPSSFPEVKILNNAPGNLKKRIRIIDDSSEREILHRVFHGLRNEFNIKIDDNDCLIYPPKTDRNIRCNIEQIHLDFKNIAIAFNHELQADIDLDGLSKKIRFMRANVTNVETKILLAEFESLTNQYENIEFNGIIPPKGDTPKDLINLFDKLINDKHYLEYSQTIQRLSIPEDRRVNLLRISELVEIIKSKKYISESWNYVSKLLKVWTGFPFPDSKTFSILFQDKSLPSFANMGDIKKLAIETWRNSININSPLRRDGLPVSSEDIIWFPILDSMKVDTKNGRIASLGKVRELLDVLERFQKER